MNTQFSLFKRKPGIFYMKNKLTGQHKTLKTRDRAEAQKLVQAHNDTANQPIFNLALARERVSPGIRDTFMTSAPASRLPIADVVKGVFKTVGRRRVDLPANSVCAKPLGPGCRTHSS